MAKNIPERPQPFPAAVRVHDFFRWDWQPGCRNGSGPETPEGQAFANRRGIVEAGGGQVGDIAKVVVEADRPVRHTITTDLPRKRVIQMEFIAVV